MTRSAACRRWSTPASAASMTSGSTSAATRPRNWSASRAPPTAMPGPAARSSTATTPPTASTSIAPRDRPASPMTPTATSPAMARRPSSTTSKTAWSARQGPRRPRWSTTRWGGCSRSPGPAPTPASSTTGTSSSPNMIQPAPCSAVTFTGQGSTIR